MDDNWGYPHFRKHPHVFDVSCFGASQNIGPRNVPSKASLHLGLIHKSTWEGQMIYGFRPESHRFVQEKEAGSNRNVIFCSSMAVILDSQSHDLIKYVYIYI